MRVHFVEPPATLRIGGLDAAIRALEAALTTQGLAVTRGKAADAQHGDVVHFHGLWRPDDAQLSAEMRRRGIPLVVSPHGMLEPWAWQHKWWKKWPYFWLVERPHLLRSACLLATSPPEEGRLRKFFPSHEITMLPLGFTGSASLDYAVARTKLHWSAEETVLLFLARLHIKKGLDLLLRALAGLDTPAAMRLVIVGGGEVDYLHEVQALANSLPLRRIDWVGEVWGEARWAYFQGADLFCLPSHSENFGLTVLEACQVGTPVLTTTMTPWGSWLREGRGFIVEPSVESVRIGLRDFFQAPRASVEKRAALAAWAQREFSWEVLAPRYAALYRRLAGQAA
jgi:glycosyltransferase involved in cell wall biosynthesis